MIGVSQAPRKDSLREGRKERKEEGGKGKRKEGRKGCMEGGGRAYMLLFAENMELLGNCCLRFQTP